jgi:hypothetical protein
MNKEGRIILKRLVMVVVLVVVLTGCTTSHTHIHQVRDKWGPPAKLERQEHTIVYYYYFQKIFPYDRWVVVEITTDLEGKILKEIEYVPQPKIIPWP